MNIFQAYMSEFTFILNNTILECQSPICQTSTINSLSLLAQTMEPTFWE